MAARAETVGIDLGFKLLLTQYIFGFPTGSPNHHKDLQNETQADTKAKKEGKPKPGPKQTFSFPNRVSQRIEIFKRKMKENPYSYFDILPNPVELKWALHNRAVKSLAYEACVNLTHCIQTLNLEKFKTEIEFLKYLGLAPLKETLFENIIPYGEIGEIESVISTLIKHIHRNLNVNPTLAVSSSQYDKIKTTYFSMLQILTDEGCHANILAYLSKAARFDQNYSIPAEILENLKVPLAPHASQKLKSRL